MFSIHILHDWKDIPWGGGNQFLKALKKYFETVGCYQSDIEKADIILFNSYPSDNEHFFSKIFTLKKDNPEVIILHRLALPFFDAWGRSNSRDDIINKFNFLFADGTIFQTEWCYQRHIINGLKLNPFFTVILNSSDPTIFNKFGKEIFKPTKVKLIASSWSGNVRKGFPLLRYLDENLDYSRYSMTFVGNSQFKFSNIHHIPPVTSLELANILKKHDIYIIASQNECCSNALIEALHCGLPCIAISGTSHGEIIQKSGEYFDDERDVISALDRVAENYDYYCSQINVPSIDLIGKQYYDFACKLYSASKEKKYQPKKLTYRNIFEYILMKIMIIKNHYEK